jgi:3-deoxy-D-manno-octulosonic acid kinase
MTKDGGQRIATSSGAMLADRHSLGNAHPGLVDANEDLFEPAFWAARGELVDVARGRGSAWFITREPQPWVLRHYRRGGFIARFSQDCYVWAGEDRVRAFAEWRLLSFLLQLGLPVPAPVAARYQRAGLFYRCDLITQRIVGADPLSSVLARGRVTPEVWRGVGGTIARLHAAGADHADLNAHNILVDGLGSISVIDFDRGRVRGPGSWAGRNLSRLQRSLVKVGRGLPADRFTPADWDSILQGYTAV